MNTCHENNKYYRSSSEDPSMKLSFKQKYWAIHEAASELTCGLNKGFFKLSNERLFELTGVKIENDIKKDRPFFYTPISGGIDFEIFGKPFQEMFLSIKNAIENYKLKGKFQHLCCGSSYLVSPWEVVVWALRNGLRIREGVQEVLKIHQDTTRPKDTFRKKIREVTKAQNLIIQDKFYRVDPVCKQIKGWGKDTSSLRKYINKELFDEPGKPGRAPNNPDSDAKNNTRHYLHKALKDVCKVEADGVMTYQFILLEEAVTTIACEILTSIDRETMRKMDVDSVLEKFGLDPIAKLYLKGAPEIIFYFVCQVVEELFFYFKDKCMPTLSEQFKASPLAKG